ncbi:TetR family transcriptional regulator [Neobacillus bataviensis LMG 21833]|uniref:TetR family transcriptional regulator n=1 Tax=Neobacillus bataviensis LMG 21833 TaxID=1117379 RepID=K6DLR6_9BACI|nr:TetR/AcrR family transcriptional regulator [Neobacillus bataviensis]EKN69259.1 TetR family transcriptional regulator [Neobacillus bataviensis LMG 21833]
MYSKFLNLDQEKQDRIINAAIKEFALKGYDRASTNEIVKEAGISKGLLFHYFGNKRQLFLFLFDYCYEIIAEQFYQKINLAEKDFFTRIRQAVMIKMELLTTYPELFKFIEEAYLEDSPEVKVEVDKKVKGLNDANFGKAYEGIDFSKFRDDMDIKKVLKIITYTFEKLSEEEFSKAKLSPTHHIDYEKVFQEAEDYFEIFTKCFYK